MTGEPVRAAVAVFLMLVLAASCGDDADVRDDSKPEIAVGSKNFTEQYILGELYAQALEANGFTVEKKLNLGSEQIADGALQSGEIDLYPEYTGTALVAVLNDQGPAPKTPEATYERAKELYAERNPADTMLTPAPFDNNYGIVATKEVAEKYDLKTLDDLARESGNLRFASNSEFQNRSDGFPNMQRHYPGLDFRETQIVNDLNLRYRALTKGEADVGVGFLTDGQIADQDLAVLTDPKSIWPFYYPAPVVRSDTLEENPKMRRILNDVSASLDLEKMRRLNAAVDLDGQEPAEVAREHLEENGLLGRP